MIKILACEKKIRTVNYSKAHFLYRLSNEYEEFLSVLLNFVPCLKLSLDCSQGTEFH